MGAHSSICTKNFTTWVHAEESLAQLQASLQRSKQLFMD